MVFMIWWSFADQILWWWSVDDQMIWWRCAGDLLVISWSVEDVLMTWWRSVDDLWMLCRWSLNDPLMICRCSVDYFRLRSSDFACNVSHWRSFCEFLIFFGRFWGPVGSISHKWRFFYGKIAPKCKQIVKCRALRTFFGSSKVFFCFFLYFLHSVSAVLLNFGSHRLNFTSRKEILI